MPSPRRARPIRVILAVVGLALLIWLGYSLVADVSQLSWPRATATVVHCTPQRDGKYSYESCLVVWTDRGTTHQAVLNLKHEIPAVGSTMRVAVHGDTIIPPDTITGDTIAAIVVPSALLVAAGIAFFYQRALRRRPVRTSSHLY